MKQRTTLFLKLALFIIVILILGFFIFMLPRVVTGLSEVIPVSAYLRYASLIALDADDASGIILFGLIVILVTGVSAVFATVFEKRCL